MEIKALHSLQQNIVGERMPLASPGIDGYIDETIEQEPPSHPVGIKIRTELNIGKTTILWDDPFNSDELKTIQREESRRAIAKFLYGEVADALINARLDLYDVVCEKSVPSASAVRLLNRLDEIIRSMRWI